MDTNSYNPFINRSMITKEGEFIGRETQLTDILTRINNRGSVSIVGDRRIGKSSLLYHIYFTGNRRLEDMENKRFNFIYIDLHKPQFKTVALFCQQLAKGLELADDAKRAGQNKPNNHLFALSEGSISIKYVCRYRMPVPLSAANTPLTTRTPDNPPSRGVRGVREDCRG